MPVTALDVRLLALLARYYVLTREQLQRLAGTEGPGGRGLRKRLTKLRHAGYLRKHPVVVLLPGGNAAAPVYYLAPAGAAVLASYYDDERFLAANSRPPRSDRLNHWLAVNESRLLIEAAVARQPEVALDGFINEWETINKDAAQREHFVLHTQLRENPPLSCSPDAALLLAVTVQERTFRKVYYLERDLGTSSPHQVAARKAKGYAELARRAGHRRHFPQATMPSFSVLCITTTAHRVREIGKQLARCESPELWLLMNEHDLTPETLLTGPVTYNHRGEAGPLVRLSATLPGAST